MRSKQYATVALGGTFDHLHAGHEAFLAFAATHGEHLQIGLATLALTSKKKLPESIQSYEQREKQLRNFLSHRHISANIFPLNDALGPTTQPHFCDALAVTTTTQSGGEVINQERQKRDLPPLPILTCPLQNDENGDAISSTRIRSGEINRQGTVFFNTLQKLEKLSEIQKNSLKQKQGKIVSQPSTAPQKFVIGDIVLETFLKNNWPYNLGIFDGRNQRQKYNSARLQALAFEKIQNPAGEISAALSSWLDIYFREFRWQKNQPSHLFIHGEEDLAAVAVILCAPLGSAVYYGQPNEGIVEVPITEEIKAMVVKRLLPDRTS